MKSSLFSLFIIVLGCQEMKQTNPEVGSPKPDNAVVLQKETPEKPEFKEADAEFQRDANDKLDKLLQSFGEKTPDYYGGAFINEKGNLVINIKGDLISGKEKITKIIGSDNIIFQNKHYSLTELSKVMNLINSFAQNPANKKYTQNLMNWSLNETENCIDVGMKDISPEKIKEFREHVTDFSAVKFYKSGGLVNQ